MAAFTTMIALGGLALAGAGAYSSYQANKEAEGARQDAAQVRNEEARVKRVHRERNLIRQAQAGRANASVYAAGSGIAGSSAYYGSLQSLNGVQAYELSSTANAYDRFTQLQGAMDRLGSARGDMAFAQGLTKIGTSMFMNASKIGAIGEEIGANGMGGLLV